jgi:hypothetical protein
MTARVLSEHWLQAIEVADAAVNAAARMDELSPEEAARHRRLLASERAWLSSFRWPKVQIGSSPLRNSDFSGGGAPRGAV